MASKRKSQNYKIFPTKCRKGGKREQRTVETNRKQIKIWQIKSNKINRIMYKWSNQPIKKQRLLD